MNCDGWRLRSLTQTWVRSEVWHIIFVILTCFHLTIFLRRKIQRAAFYKQSGFKICHLGPAFIIHFVFRRQRAEMKTGQNTKYDITKTSDLAQIWSHLYICMASALIISPPNFWAISKASFDFPAPVAPRTTTIGKRVEVMLKSLNLSSFFDDQDGL